MQALTIDSICLFLELSSADLNFQRPLVMNDKGHRGFFFFFQKNPKWFNGSIKETSVYADW